MESSYEEGGHTSLVEKRSYKRILGFNDENIENIYRKSLFFLSGATGGMIAGIITCPLETVKTRLQTKKSRDLLSHAHLSTAKNQNYKMTTSSVLKTIVKNEGIGGLWRGLTPILVGVVPARALYFGSYSYAKNLLKDYGLEGSIYNFTAASFAGCVGATFTCPIWVIKTRLQLMPSHNPVSAKFMGIADMAKMIYRREGLLAFFKGLRASYWGVMEGAIQLTLYEQMKSFIEEPTSVQLFSLAATAKLFAAASTYPHEVVRTRQRDQITPKSGIDKYNGMISSLRTIFKEEGIIGLYGGLIPHLWKVVPNAAIMYIVVETISGIK